MICEVRQRSVLHLEQWRREEWPERRGDVGGRMGWADGGRVVVLLEKGEVVDWVMDIEVEVEAVERREAVLVLLEVESLELCRDLRRKGREGARKVGKNARFARGSDGRRK
jgi:hypothetical protein